MDRAFSRKEILDAFDITEEDMAAFEATPFAQAGAEARRRYEAYAAALPGRVQRIVDDMNADLPEGMSFRIA